MLIRYYIDPETDQPHIYGHGVWEDEVQQVLRNPGDDFPGTNDTRQALGKTTDGRYLQVIYRPDEDADSVFVITAFDLTGKALKAYRRRQRKKGK